MNWIPNFIWIVPMSFFCCRIPFRVPHCIWFSCLLKSHLVNNSFAVFLCFGWPWHFWGELVRYCVECPSMWVYLIFFIWLVWVLGRKTTEVKFCPHHIISRDKWYPHDITHYNKLDHLFKVVFAKFLYCSVTVFFFPYPYSLATTH